MPYCPKCGAQVEENMVFCPKCGASLKAEQPRTVEEQAKQFGERTRKEGGEFGQRMKGEKEEKTEKREKQEKGEKGEKHEKREYSFIGPLIGGLILIFTGLTFYLQITGNIKGEILWAFFFVIIGVIIIVGALLAMRRYPKPRGTI